MLTYLTRRLMATQLSKTQVDRLGDRLRKGAITEADIRLLDHYRRSFSEAYEGVVEAIRTELGLELTGRPAKSTTSISDKLRRESIRLSQIQDIAGCRLIVPDIANQNSVVESLTSLFERTTVSDRRAKPSHGYRAVHVVVNSRDKLIEIQVRTELQHLWAELSEKYSDVIDPAIKYGGGDKNLQEILIASSLTIAQEESLETQIEDILASESSPTVDDKSKLTQAREDLNLLRQKMREDYRDIIQCLEGTEGDSHDISN